MFRYIISIVTIIIISTISIVTIISTTTMATKMAVCTNKAAPGRESDGLELMIKLFIWTVLRHLCFSKWWWWHCFYHLHHHHIVMMSEGMWCMWWWSLSQSAMVTWTRSLWSSRMSNFHRHHCHDHRTNVFLDVQCPASGRVNLFETFVFQLVIVSQSWARQVIRET